ncbi:MAG: putative LPS assembly protein LptD [Nitrospiraceae bacterium]|nr:putative LPS assembly protein LptD [Nitrospiraceae bacterium]
MAAPERAVEKIGGSTITADSATYSDGRYYFHGSVHARRGDMRGGADNAVYDEATGDLYLAGDVYLVDPDVVVNAKKARLNLKKKTGMLYDASIFLRARNFYIKSPEIIKTGPGDYILEKAIFTACDSPKPAWSLTGGKTEVTVNRQVRIKNAWLMVGPVPVLYTPMFLSPIGNKRASGFLAPNAGYTSFGGAYLELPYYWAIANNRDATVDLEYYSKRAVGASVEQRYLEPDGFAGSDRLTYLKDWQDNVDYLYLRGHHAGPDGFLNLDLANHSDFNKLYDFNFQDRERRFLESKAEAHLDVPDTGEAFLRARWFQDELDGADQSAVLQELPEAGFYFYPRRVGPELSGRPLVFNMDGSAANFWREDGQSAIRLYAAPRISYATGDKVHFFQSAGLGFRHYDFFNPARDIGRAVFDYDAALRSRIQKTYQNGVTHYVEPTLEFIYRDLSGPVPPVVLDSLELEDKAELLQATILNRMLDRRGEFLDLSLSDAYDGLAGRLQPIVLNVSASRPAAVSAALAYDPNTLELTALQLNTNFRVWQAALFFLSETYSQATGSWVHNINSQVAVSRAVTLINGGWYDSKAGLQEFHSEVRYSSQCWGMDIVFSKKPGDTSFFVRMRLLGIGRSA